MDLEKYGSGKIMEVLMTNFMCHRNFRINFGPHLNFLIGENGSGKSAILVAISVGLGARPGFSQRGSRLSSLVHDGSGKASVEIRLSNHERNEPYRYDVYGDSIYIRRNISSNGNSEYRIMNSAKTVVSKVKNEVTKILEHFNIQVNNPCTILMQDTAKTFLQNSSATCKYEFFLMASSLDAILKNLNASQTYIELSSASLQRRKDILVEMEREVAEKKKEYLVVKESDNLIQSINNKYNELMWTKIQEKEKDVESIEKRILAIEKVKMEKEKANKTLSDEHKGSVSARVDELTGIHHELLKQKEDFQGQVDEFSRCIDIIDGDMDGVERRKSQAQRNIRGFMKNINLLSRRIKDVQEKLKTHVDTDHNRRAILHKEIEDLEREIANLEDVLSGYEEQEQEITANEGIFARKQIEFNRTLNKLNYDLSNLLKEEQNNLNHHGKDVENLFRECKRRKLRVAGPISEYVKIRNEMYGDAVEKCCANTLRLFVSTDYEDSRKFKQVAYSNNVRSVPGIATMKDNHGIYNIAQHRLPPAKYDTVLRVLEAKDSDGRDNRTPGPTGLDVKTISCQAINALIDMQKIETKCLFPNLEEAWNEMRNGVPNCNVAFTRDLWTIQKGRHSTSQIAPPKRFRRQLMRVSKDQEVKELKEEIKTLEADKLNIVQKGRELAQSKMPYRAKVAESKKTLHEKKSELSRKRAEVSALTFEQQSADNVEAWEDDLRDFQQKISEMKEKIENEKKQLADFDEKLKYLEDKKQFQVGNQKRILQSNRELLKKIDVAKRNLHEADAEKHTVLRRLDQLRDELREIDIQIESEREVLQNRKSFVSSLVDEASKKCRRIRVSESPDSIRLSIIALEDQKKEFLSRVRNPQEVVNDYKSSMRKFVSMKKSIRFLESNIEVLRQSVTKRKQTWLKLLKSCGSMASKFFSYFIRNRRGFWGQLNFDYVRRELELSVRLGFDSHKVSDMKTLSGGEKSFSTVTLLLALWQEIEGKFFAMDEFDVFMDDFFRKVTVDTFLWMSSKFPEKQYVFLTPRDIPGLSRNERVTIHELNGPRQ